MMLVKAYTALTAAARRNNPSSQSLGRYNVLRVLHTAEDHRLLMSEIGDQLETSPTVVTRLVDALVADGLVRRIDHPDDKRKTWAEITDTGAALFEAESPLMMLEVQKLWLGRDGGGEAPAGASAHEGPPQREVCRPALPGDS